MLFVHALTSIPFQTLVMRRETLHTFDKIIHLVYFTFTLVFLRASLVRISIPNMFPQTFSRGILEVNRRSERKFLQILKNLIS